jgi:hypothetical protein
MGSNGVLGDASYCFGRVMGYAKVVFNLKGEFRQAEAPSR